MSKSQLEIVLICYEAKAAIWRKMQRHFEARHAMIRNQLLVELGRDVNPMLQRCSPQPQKDQEKDKATLFWDCRILWLS